MRRLVAILSLVTLLVGAVGVLYLQGRVGLETERLRLIDDARADNLAALESIRQDVAAELEGLIERESSRAYYQYQHLYVPPEVVSNQLALVPSPLVEKPNEPLVQLYVQYRGGALESPPVTAHENDESPYGAQATAQLASLVPLQASCKTRLEDDETGVPQENVFDSLITSSNANLPQTLEQLAGVQEELQANGALNPSVKQGALNTQWAAYQDRGGKRPTSYVGSKGKLKLPPPPQTKTPPEAQTQTAPPPRPSTVKVRVFPFRPLRVLQPDGWPEHLLVLRRVEVGDDAWLQGFSVNVPYLRDVLLPTVLARQNLPTDSQLSYADQVQLSLTSDPGAGPRRILVVPTAQTAGRAGQTLALLAPLEEVSLVHLPDPVDPGSTLDGSRFLLDGALALVALVVLVGSGILFVAARGQRKLAQQRADFVAALTHELKAPLTGVRALTELLHDGIVTDPVKRQEYYGSMLAECDRLSRLVHNVLSVAKLERGQLPVLLETLDPLPVLVAVADRFAPRLDSIGYRFEVVLPKALPAVHADRDGMDQIVSNLLDNAAKYGRSGSPETDLIRLEAVADDGVLRVAVVDHGPGVKAGEREQIFGQFFRSPGVPREVGGAGLGLAIARAVARAARGDLRCTSDPNGAGARFELDLPLAESAT